MGSFGPMKVDASTPETIAGPPFRYGANPDTLLDITDLVFIDAPTTGLSRELGKAEPKDFFGVDKDLDAFTRTIQRYLTKYGRWNSPKFIIGESYGTTRAAGLVEVAARQRGPAQRHRPSSRRCSTSADSQGDQSLINFLPTYAADAWYHGKIAAQADLMSFLGEARDFAGGPYAAALAEGQRASATRRSSRSRSRWRGSPASRPTISCAPTCACSPTGSSASCCATAARSSAGSIRAIVGTEADTAGEGAELRPAGERDHRRLRRRAQRLSVPRSRLQDAAHLPAEQLCRDSANDWNFQHNAPDGAAVRRRHQRRSRRGDAREPADEVLSVNGSTTWRRRSSARNMSSGTWRSSRSSQANIRYTYYPAGHMMYIDPASARQLKADLAAFYASANKQMKRAGRIAPPALPPPLKGISRFSAAGSPRHICRGGRPRSRTRAGRLR